MESRITGSTAAEIAESIRELHDHGHIAAGDTLPPVRTLAERLTVNRNTVVSAYRQLVLAGIAQTHGRGGTRIVDHERTPQEGFAPGSVLRDVGTGNPDPRLIPDPSAALSAVVGRPVLYGEPVIDEALEEWAQGWTARDLPDVDLRLTVTSGAVDAVERLLAQALTRDDAVALEDPCWLAGIQTARLGGYRTIPVPVDEHGMTVDGLRAAMDAGARAVICTPRAQNPTGASLSAERASALRDVLTDHPYALVIEDDHFSLLSQQPFHSIVPTGHRRFALVRSVSKFLGPDMCLAIVASDPTTAERLALRLSPGTTWVSHLLQRLAATLLADPDVRTQIDDAGRHYAQRNGAFLARLATHRGDASTAGAASTDGLNVWVRTPVPARDVRERLMLRGWLARLGDDFTLTDVASTHLRLTVHDLDDDDADQLAADLATAVTTAVSKVG
ncbi:aminotransferase class I/II-fold pyridoxal phosphate-dependent enzyme [Microbacterium sp. KR10-403]|uniref:aminotransferase class I/II-fold pyridoxal phosphate-dependent enzyme n=1 Tax=Microbacterium sp. KR10-403 TaxID=3158581 RepID=UPI0032E4F331